METLTQGVVAVGSALVEGTYQLLRFVGLTIWGSFVVAFGILIAKAMIGA